MIQNHLINASTHNMSTHIINPRTNRKIQVNGQTYKKLSIEEREIGMKLWLNKLEHKIEQKGECLICTNEVIVCKTKCCSQNICKDCYIKMASYKCPYCRATDPISLSPSDKKEKENIISSYNNRDEEMNIFRIHDIQDYYVANDEIDVLRIIIRIERQSVEEAIRREIDDELERID